MSEPLRATHRTFASLTPARVIAGAAVFAFGLLAGAGFAAWLMPPDNNLSRAWSRLLLRILDGAGTEVSPLVLSVTGFDDNGVVPDRHRAGPTLDAEVKMLLLLPPGTEITGASLAYERDLASGRLFRAVRPGIVQASANSGAWAVFVRIAPRLRHGWRVRPVGRVVARHIGRHLPGNPTVTPQNMEGAGSYRAANFIYNVAPKDGTSIALIS
jgi:hypothetical protein